ncbi:hypothetical protein BIW11_00767 [Tropilaelaps mercedesae]|uniref:Uncharacterized protein n=1 Tax=Tropilaelaps mercedesae TaxID=418985 RepID=A0A1V9XPP7_9ACAR|nr:hypothetical protein BIW11_00767 [Tropilaelaps mercedesae]
MRSSAAANSNNFVWAPVADGGAVVVACAMLIGPDTGGRELDSGAWLNAGWRANLNRDKLREVESQFSKQMCLLEWKIQVSEYQVASNARAQERVKELLEEKKRRAQRDREGREKSFRKGLERVSVLEGERLTQMIQRLRQKEERARQFTTEKQAFINQSRALAKASSDLREQLKLKTELVEHGGQHGYGREGPPRRRRGSSSTRSGTSTCDSTSRSQVTTTEARVPQISADT